MLNDHFKDQFECCEFSFETVTVTWVI